MTENLGGNAERYPAPSTRRMKRVADFRGSQVCDCRTPRCTGQRTLETAQMMVPGRCSRQRVSRIGGANPLPHGARPWFDSPAKIIRLRRQQRAPEQGPGFTQEQFAQLVRRYKSRCLACRQRYERLVPDHVVPLAKGGDHHISNIQPLCYECNAFKGTQVRDYRRLICKHGFENSADGAGSDSIQTSSARTWRSSTRGIDAVMFMPLVNARSSPALSQRRSPLLWERDFLVSQIDLSLESPAVVEARDCVCRVPQERVVDRLAAAYTSALRQGRSAASQPQD